ncbi:MAG: 1-acyl-sn-glycerol-3-phosphate acyltransferase [Turicibacter sp.]|nr:1-acyl-sn-glycerol-3-phosphate acyltransferase [Turicibacter sp.]
MNKFVLGFFRILPEKLLANQMKKYIDWQIAKKANLKVSGMEHLDEKKGPYLFVCNHLSNSDGLILNKVLEREDVTFIAGKKLGANAMTNLGFSIVKSIPISPSSADMEAIKSVVSTVKAGNSIVIFPEGTRSRTAKMIEGKKGIVLFAKMTKAVIVPMAIWGSEKFMPINDNMSRETFYDANVHVKIGKPFLLGKAAENQSKKDWDDHCLNLIMGRIAELLPESYQGAYGVNHAL